MTENILTVVSFRSPVTDINDVLFTFEMQEINNFFSCPQLKEQATDSISVLEGALQLKKDFYVHTLRTLDLLAADAAANGETESSTAGLRISADELHCQVSVVFNENTFLL